ncbi:MAG: hypothetical protein AAFY88_13770 [Acidobacteriota bacterium]
MTTPALTVAIPLYRSAPFLDIISANIEQLPADAEILLSDRHGDDDAIDRLERRHRGDRRLRCLRRRDRKDWVHNINLLLQEARGEYWRLLPHDDSSDAAALAALRDCLERHPRTLLAYGPTRAVDLEGRRLPERDHGNPHPVDNDAPWRLGLALDCFSRGHFNGAFKGLVRRSEIVRRQLWIRRTFGSVYSERAWLAALALAGRMRYVADAVYTKRFHPESAHARWRPGPAHELSFRRIWLSYLRDGLSPELYRRARRYVNWTTCLRLGLATSPPPPPVEPWLPAAQEGTFASLLARVHRPHADDWRELHALCLPAD